MPKAVILGCEGPGLSDWERAFFGRAQPFGFILFARNCIDPEQIRALVGDLRGAVGRDAPVLIDQEGGRVARLKPPTWRAAPPAARFGELAARDPGAGEMATRLNARLIAEELRALGITVDCLPLLDLRRPETHTAIGDRAFAADPSLVARLGRAVSDGLLDGGVMPVVKHMPGHGRAVVDSHDELPVVHSDLATLEASDFAPFRALRDAPWGMTAHIVFPAIDPEHPVTTSARAIAEVIRGRIGFGGVLVSDDLSMSALSGSLGERAAAAIEAGCDLALHCNGDPDEMEAVAGAVGPVGAATQERLARAEATLQARAGAAATIDFASAAAELDRMLAAA